MQVAIDEARESGKATLRRLQWQRATAGSDTMCIWLGKQLLGQRDRQEDADRQPDQSMRVVVEFVGEPGPPTLNHAPQPDDRARVTDLRKHVQLVGSAPGRTKAEPALPTSDLPDGRRVKGSASSMSAGQ